MEPSRPTSTQDRMPPPSGVVRVAVCCVYDLTAAWLYLLDTCRALLSNTDTMSALADLAPDAAELVAAAGGLAEDAPLVAAPTLLVFGMILTHLWALGGDEAVAMLSTTALEMVRSVRGKEKGP